MKNKPANKNKEGSPVRLVWLITLLSFSVGVFMVSLVWSTLTDLRTERERLFGIRENFNVIRATLESSLSQHRSELADLLEANLSSGSQQEDSRLLSLIRDYRELVSNPDIALVFDQLEKNAGSLLSIKNKLTWWASAFNRTVPRIPQARKEVTAILDRLFETIDRAEGQQRLETAAKIRKIKRDDNESTLHISMEEFKKLLSSNNFSVIRRDITDLVQLSERLHTIYEADNLADLKDNKIRTMLARVRLNAKPSEGEKSTEKLQLTSLLDEYETAMFGQGYSIDNDHQTIVLGYDGEFNLVLDQLKLTDEREMLRVEANRTYDLVEASLGEISARTDIITQQEVIKVEKMLGQTWRTMVIIWLVTSLIYAMLAYEIITAARQQIKAIEDSNIELEIMADELRQSEERLHRLSSDLFSVQENERRRISLELHDELGQSMAALKLQVSSIARRLGEVPPEELKNVCQEMRDNINQIIENVRRLARDLSPVVLDDLGLHAAIEYLVNNFSKIYNIEIRYQLTEINHLFDEESQRIIYRILQEALTNIGKHAEAQHVSLVVEEKDRAVQFTVKDDGKGFNVQKALDKKGADRGMGLTTMAERVRILGGAISIASRPGIDTTITFTAPTR